MHHKLLTSRLVSKDALFGHDQDPVRNPTFDAKNSASTSTKPKQQEKHVPLNFGLAKIVSLELASDDEESAAKNNKKASSCADAKDVHPVDTTSAAPPSATKKPKPHPLERPKLVDRKEALVHPMGTQTISYAHAAPLTGHSSLLAARMAEEQEALALFLRQRQQSSLQMELEQIRRMQTAMFLYQHTGPSAASLPYLDSLVASRQAAAAAAAKLASEMYPRQQPQPGATPSSQAEAKPKPATAGSSGANPTLLSLAPKRALDCMKEKPIKERPEEYQHLSKKAKRTPLQMAFTGELRTATSSNYEAEDDEDSDTSDSEKNGHRFRPYQYEQWTEKFQELCDFRKTKGHCQVPHTYKDNPPLARWVKRQRYQYKLKVEGKMSTMTDERVTLLENIGFIWDSHAAAWAEKLHELKDYAMLRGDCNVPSTYPENPQLATWVKCQRRQYKLLRDGKTSNMTVDRILELDKVGFVWEVRKTWEHTPEGMERVVAAAVAANGSS